MINNSHVLKDRNGIANSKPDWKERNDYNFSLDEDNVATTSTSQSIMPSTRIDVNNKLVEDLSSGEECYEDEGNRSAPIELLSEFLSSLMLRDYETALNQCTSILQFEPGNKTVQEFYPFIQQRLSEADADRDEAESTFDDESMASTGSRNNSRAASLDMDSSSDEYETADNTLWTIGPGAVESDSTGKEDEEDLEDSEEISITHKIQEP